MSHDETSPKLGALGVALRILVVILLVIGIGAMVRGIIIQLAVNRHVATLSTETTVFGTNNPMDADKVDSTVYFSRDELLQFAGDATRTFVVSIVKTTTSRPTSVWAYVEVPGATTPYGAQISEAPKGKNGWYDYRLKSYRTEVGTVVMVWEPFTRKWNLATGFWAMFIIWVLALAVAMSPKSKLIPMP